MRLFPAMGLGLALLIPGAVSASPFDPLLDFREGMYAAGDGDSSYLFHVGGYDLLFETLAYDGGGLVTDGRLDWSNIDGFGIRGEGYENDEIEAPEVLRISFSHSAMLERVLVADLFVESGYAERGSYSVNGGSSWVPFVADGAYSNGEVELPVNAMTSSILFTAPGKIQRRTHEFSVAGLDARWADRQFQGSAPEPGAALLFSAGLLLMRGRPRRLSAGATSRAAQPARP